MSEQDDRDVPQAWQFRQWLADVGYFSSWQPLQPYYVEEFRAREGYEVRELFPRPTPPAAGGVVVPRSAQWLEDAAEDRQPWLTDREWAGVNALCERSKDDRCHIVGSEVRWLIMLLRRQRDWINRLAMEFQAYQERGKGLEEAAHPFSRLSSSESTITITVTTEEVRRLRKALAYPENAE